MFPEKINQPNVIFTIKLIYVCTYMPWNIGFFHFNILINLFSSLIYLNTDPFDTYYSTVYHTDIILILTFLPFVFSLNIKHKKHFQKSKKI